MEVKTCDAQCVLEITFSQFSQYCFPSLFEYKVYNLDCKVLLPLTMFFFASTTQIMIPNPRENLQNTVYMHLHHSLVVSFFGLCTISKLLGWPLPDLLDYFHTLLCSLKDIVCRVFMKRI